MQLALEHKALPYERKVLSFSAGDTRKPEFLALNPRHRVPVLVHEDFVLYESNAIVEYLDEAFPATGAPLFPGDVRTRALVRRLIMEVDGYFDHAIDPLTTQAFSKKPEERDAQGDRRQPQGGRRRDRACSPSPCAASFSREPLSAADFALYPLVAFLKRCEMKLPDLDADGMLTPEFRAWKGASSGCRISKRPYRLTGRQPDETAMELSTSAFADNGVIPAEFAFGAIDAART